MLQPTQKTTMYYKVQQSPYLSPKGTTHQSNLDMPLQIPNKQQTTQTVRPQSNTTQNKIITTTTTNNNNNLPRQNSFVHKSPSIQYNQQNPYQSPIIKTTSSTIYSDRDNSIQKQHVQQQQTQSQIIGGKDNLEMSSLKEKISMLQNEKQEMKDRESHLQKMNNQLVEAIQTIGNGGDDDNLSNNMTISHIIQQQDPGLMRQKSSNILMNASQISTKSTNRVDILNGQHEAEIRSLKGLYQNRMNNLEQENKELQNQKEQLQKDFDIVQQEFEKQKFILKDQFQEIQNIRLKYEKQNQEIKQQLQYTQDTQKEKYLSQIASLQDQLQEEKNKFMNQLENQENHIKSQYFSNDIHEKSILEEKVQQANLEKSMIQNLCQDQTEKQQDIIGKLNKDLDTVKRHREEAYDKIKRIQKEKSIIKNQIVDQNLLFDKILVLEKEKQKLIELKEDNEKLQRTIDEVNDMYTHLKAKQSQMEQQMQPTEIYKQLEEKYLQTKQQLSEEQKKNKMYLDNYVKAQEDYQKKIATILKETLGKDEKIRRLQKKIKSMNQNSMIHQTSRVNLDTTSSPNTYHIKTQQDESFKMTARSSHKSPTQLFLNNTQIHNTSTSEAAFINSIDFSQSAQNPPKNSKFIDIKSPLPKKDSQNKSLLNIQVSQYPATQRNSQKNNDLLNETHNNTQNIVIAEISQDIIEDLSSKTLQNDTSTFFPSNSQSVNNNSSNNNQNKKISKELETLLKNLLEDKSQNEKIQKIVDTCSLKSLETVIKQIHNEKKQQEILQHCKSDKKIILNISQKDQNTKSSKKLISIGGGGTNSSGKIKIQKKITYNHSPSIVPSKSKTKFFFNNNTSNNSVKNSNSNSLKKLILQTDNPNTLRRKSSNNNNTMNQTVQAIRNTNTKNNLNISTTNNKNYMTIQNNNNNLNNTYNDILERPDFSKNVVINDYEFNVENNKSPQAIQIPNIDNNSIKKINNNNDSNLQKNQQDFISFAQPSDGVQEHFIIESSSNNTVQQYHKPQGQGISLDDLNDSFGMKKQKRTNSEVREPTLQSNIHNKTQSVSTNQHFNSGQNYQKSTQPPASSKNNTIHQKNEKSSQNKLSIYSNNSSSKNSSIRNSINYKSSIKLQNGISNSLYQQKQQQQQNASEKRQITPTISQKNILKPSNQKITNSTYSQQYALIKPKRSTANLKENQNTSMGSVYSENQKNLQKREYPSLSLQKKQGVKRSKSPLRN